MTEAEHLKKIKEYIDMQAKDDGLWLINPATIWQAYLQQRIRELHAVIESASAEFIDDKIRNYY